MQSIGVLLIGDQVFEKIASSLPFQIERAGSFETGLQKLQFKSFDALVLDRHLKSRKTYWINWVFEIHKRFPKLAIVAVSKAQNLDELKKAYEVGLTDHISILQESDKDFLFSELNVRLPEAVIKSGMKSLISVPTDPKGFSKKSYKEFLDRFDRIYLTKAINIFNGNIASLSEQMKISHVTVYKRIRKFNLKAIKNRIYNA